MILQSYSFNWHDFVIWFLSLPLIYQIIVGVGIATIVILVLIGVYYLLKGIAYLIYYILKGVYYLIKGIAIGIYRLLTWIYNLIIGKNETNKQEPESTELIVAQPALISVANTIEQNESELVRYCPECGIEFTNSMIRQLNKDGYVYCSYCGKKLDNLVSVES
ncbi:MAG: zinc ribbon domain-containing protein [Promethearchaeota archaeon]